MGWQGFVRDRSATSAALIVMSIVLFLVSSLIMIRGFGNFLIISLQERIDISTYFKETATEGEILQLKDELARLPEVKEVQYVSKEEALKRFREKQQDNEVVMRSLEAVGGNPLSASLSIKAWNPQSFERITGFLANSPFFSVISSVDYEDRGSLIARAGALVNGIQAGVLATSIAIGAIAVLIAFNTIRLTIYNAKAEIGVMRLVGAANWFIRGPFLMQGILVGIFSTIIAQLLLAPVAYFLSGDLESFTQGFNLWNFYKAHIALTLGLQLAAGIGLGILSSAIAIGKHLKV